MIKVVLFDADGVVVTPEKIFSERVHEEYGVPQKEFKNFFYGDFQKCLVGQANLKVVLMTVEGIQLPIESKEDLIAYKKAMARVVDLEDLEQIS